MRKFLAFLTALTLFTASVGTVRAGIPYRMAAGSMITAISTSVGADGAHPLTMAVYNADGSWDIAGITDAQHPSPSGTSVLARAEIGGD